MKDVCFICRRDSTSKVFKKLRRRTSKKCFPLQTPKVRCSAELSLRCILGPKVSLRPASVLVPQLCLCWSACCCWTRRAGPQPQKPSLCLTSPSSETQRKRQKHSCTTTRWTTRTCLWASGNVRSKSESGENVAEQQQNPESWGLLMVALLRLFVFQVTHSQRS